MAKKSTENYPASGVISVLKNAAESYRFCSKFLPFMAVSLTKLQHPFSAAYLCHHEISPSPLHKDINGGSRVIELLILNSALDGGQSSVSDPGRYTAERNTFYPLNSKLC